MAIDARIDHDHAQQQQEKPAPEQGQIDFGRHAPRHIRGGTISPPPFQGMHGVNKDFGAMRVIAEHVKTGTSRRKQHGIAVLCLLGTPAHGAG